LTKQQKNGSKFVAHTGQVRTGQQKMFCEKNVVIIDLTLSGGGRIGNKMANPYLYEAHNEEREQWKLFADQTLKLAAYFFIDNEKRRKKT
jgi:hypothetical protein